MSFRLLCSACHREHDPASLAWRCACGGLLDLAPFEAQFPQRAIQSRPATLGRYREALEASEWREKDPILRLERHGLAEGWFAEEGLAEVRSAAAAAVEEAVSAARASPFPGHALIGAMVYANA